MTNVYCENKLVFKLGPDFNGMNILGLIFKVGENIYRISSIGEEKVIAQLIAPNTKAKKIDYEF